MVDWGWVLTFNDLYLTRVFVSENCHSALAGGRESFRCIDLVTRGWGYDVKDVSIVKEVRSNWVHYNEVLLRCV